MPTDNYSYPHYTQLDVLITDFDKLPKNNLDVNFTPTSRIHLNFASLATRREYNIIIRTIHGRASPEMVGLN